MKNHLKTAVIIILALSALAGAGLFLGKSGGKTRASVPRRGNDVARDGIESELRSIYNDPGERSVLVMSRGAKLTLTFQEELLNSLRRTFYARHKNDFKRFYEAGFDTLTIEAKKEGGMRGELEFDLTQYKYR